MRKQTRNRIREVIIRVEPDIYGFAEQYYKIKRKGKRIIQARRVQ